METTVKMSAQLFSGMNKLDKKLWSFFETKPIPVHIGEPVGISSFTSTMQATDPSFHFYDYASVTLSPPMFQRNIK